MRDFEELLSSRINTVTDSTVREAMAYSLLSGGKRIRPRLLYETLEGYGCDPSLGDHMACAIEMIHTYSLIHDDLPAMDNDDLRRGRPTCHKQFDEATAILAGDGLLTQAFREAALTEADPAAVLHASAVLAEMAGPDGMVYGQCLDMAEESGTTGWEELKKVHKYKTGCLLSAPLMIAAVLSGHEEEKDLWHEIGDLIGLAFQVQDDVLDLISTPEELGKSNSDDRNGKVTAAVLFGVEKAEKMMHALYEEACGKIRSVPGFDPSKLTELLEQLRYRTK